MKKIFKIESFTLMTSFCLVAMANTAKATESCQYVDEADGSISYCCEEATCPANSYATEDECLQAGSVNALRGCRQVNDCWRINPCEYSSQASCEEYAGSPSHTSTNAFACTVAEDECYYPSGCKSPYSDSQPTLCQHNNQGHQIDLEKLTTKTAENHNGNTIRCYKKEALACDELTEHGSLLYPNWANGYTYHTNANPIRMYRTIELSAGSGCETKVCHDNGDNIIASQGYTFRCTKSGYPAITGTYYPSVYDATGFTNVEGYLCSTVYQQKTYKANLRGSGYFVKE